MSLVQSPQCYCSGSFKAICCGGWLLRSKLPFLNACETNWMAGNGDARRGRGSGRGGSWSTFRDSLWFKGYSYIAIWGVRNMAQECGVYLMVLPFMDGGVRFGGGSIFRDRPDPFWFCAGRLSNTRSKRVWAPQTSKTPLSLFKTTRLHSTPLFPLVSSSTDSPPVFSQRPSHSAAFSTGKARYTFDMTICLVSH